MIGFVLQGHIYLFIYPLFQNNYSFFMIEFFHKCPNH